MREREAEMRKNKLLTVERSKEAIELGFTQAVFGKELLTVALISMARHK